MKQAIQQCRRTRTVVIEDLRPLLERLVRRDHRLAPLIALTVHLVSESQRAQGHGKGVAHLAIEIRHIALRVVDRTDRDAW